MRMRLGIKLATAVMCALPLCGAVIAVGAPSASAATCKGDTCAGHDPNVYGCGRSSSTSANAASGGHTLATLVNWYSSGCNSNWSQGTLTSYAVSQHDTEIITIDTSDSDGYEFMCYPGPDNTGSDTEDCYGYGYGGSATAWTDMVNGTDVTYSVIYVYNSSGTEIAQASTSQ